MNPLIITIPLVILAMAVLKPGAAHAQEHKALPALTRSAQELSQPTSLPEGIVDRLEPDTAYPATVTALAEKWGKVFQIPRSWIRSQAYAESKNKPLLTNERSGATGLLQIKLATALDIVRWLTKTRFMKNLKVKDVLASRWHGRREDLKDPDLNVMLAVFYMRVLKRKFGNNHRLVAAAYNQGPGAVARSLAESGEIPEKAGTYVSMVEDAKARGFI